LFQIDAEQLKSMVLPSTRPGLRANLLRLLKEEGPYKVSLHRTENQGWDWLFEAGPSWAIVADFVELPRLVAYARYHGYLNQVIAQLEEELEVAKLVLLGAEP
jgi:hypothetical protein